MAARDRDQPFDMQLKLLMIGDSGKSLSPTFIVNAHNSSSFLFIDTTRGGQNLPYLAVCCGPVLYKDYEYNRN
jgi:hypothetical protein